MPAVSHVLVVGGGIGGLAAARALRQRGIAVDLIEKEPQWTVYGVGIIQPNNALRALERIGLAQACLEHGGAFDGWRMHDADGKVLFDPPGNRGAAPHLPAHNGITRPKLHDILIAGAREAGADIRLGTTVHAYGDNGDSVDVTLSNGDRRRYDLVIGIDGAFSETRRMLFGDRYRPQFTGQGVWRYNFRRPAEVDTGAVFFGPDSKVGLVPLSDTLMYMFIVTAEPGDGRIEGVDMADAMRHRLKSYNGLVAQLREQIVDPAGVVYRPMLNILVDSPWRKGRVMLAGDAAHTTTPHLAQGAAMALEDAVLLGELLGEDRDLDAALEEFMRRRFDRTKFVVDQSTQLAMWELEEWDGVVNPEADPGRLVAMATAELMTEY